MSLLAENIQPKNFTPKYVGLARDLLRDIARRRLGRGDRLSTENELVERYGFSRVTVRQALELLENEGYVSRERARGTFVQRAVDSAEQFGMIHGTVLVVCSNEQSLHRQEDAAFTTVLYAMEQALASKGFTVQLATVGQNPTEDRKRLSQMVARGDLEGVLTIGPYLDPYRDIFTGLPAVTSCTFAHEKQPWVGDDVSVVCRESILHLIKHGHRDIAMVCGPGIDGRAFAQFAKGYREAFDRSKLPWDRALMFQAHPDEDPNELARQVLTSRIRPTAAFGENWLVCRALIREAIDEGLKVPQDLSLVGYGQNVLEINDPVPVTAYVPQTAQIGAAAADLLTDLITGHAEPTQEPVTIDGHLVERESVLPPSEGPAPRKSSRQQS